MVAQTQLTSVEPTTTSHATPRHPRPAGRAWVASAAGPGLSAVLSLLVAVQSLRLWEWRPGVPLSLSGDAPQVFMQVRAIMEGGGFGSTTRMGAPFGLNAAWFATGDQLNFTAIRVIGLFTDSPATASAVFFVAGYPAAALAAYWLARQLGIARPAAVTVGVLFSALPGHQQWFQHLWLSAYWMLPLGVWLALHVATGQVTDPSRGPRSPIWKACHMKGSNRQVQPPSTSFSALRAIQSAMNRFSQPCGGASRNRARATGRVA